MTPESLPQQVEGISETRKARRFRRLNEKIAAGVLVAVLTITGCGLTAYGLSVDTSPARSIGTESTLLNLPNPPSTILHFNDDNAPKNKLATIETVPFFNFPEITEKKDLEVPIIAYHGIETSNSGLKKGGIIMSKRQFNEEMDFLEKNNYHPVTVDQIYESINLNLELPQNPIAITFDDGLADNYKVAFPILKAHGFVATFFIVTAAVGRPGYMTWGQLLEIKKTGMSMESHTVHHHDLTKLSPQRLKAELQGSKDAINSHLGIDPEIISDPGGKLNYSVEQAEMESGYVAAVTCNPNRAINENLNFSWPRKQIGSAETIVSFAKDVGQS